MTARRQHSSLNVDAVKRSSRPTTLGDFAYETLLTEIVEGRIPPGAPIRLQAWAQRLGVSPIPIREALRRLEQSGLVDIAPHHGANVVEMSVADMEDTYRVRAALEVLAIRAAAISFSDDDDAEARRLLQQYSARAIAGDERTAREAHSAFHFALYRPARSRWMDLFLPQLWASTERYRRIAVKAIDSPRDRTEEHKALLKACRSRDPDIAEAALTAHFARTQRAIAEHLSKSTRPGARPAHVTPTRS